MTDNVYFKNHTSLCIIISHHKIDDEWPTALERHACKTDMNENLEADRCPPMTQSTHLHVIQVCKLLE